MQERSANALRTGIISVTEGAFREARRTSRLAMFVPPNEHRSERSEQSNTAPRARAAKVRCASVGGAQPTSVGTMSETRFSSREE